MQAYGVAQVTFVVEHAVALDQNEYEFVTSLITQFRVVVPFATHAPGKVAIVYIVVPEQAPCEMPPQLIVFPEVSQGEVEVGT